MESALPTDSNETHEKQKHIGVASKQSVAVPSAAENVKRSSNIDESNVTLPASRAAAPLLSARIKEEGIKASDSDRFMSRISRPTISSSISMSKRRNSTGDVLEKQTVATQKRLGGMSSLSGKKATPTTEPSKNNLEGRRASLPSTSLKPPVPVMRKTSFNSQLSPKPAGSRLDSVRKSGSKSSQDSSPSNSNGRSTFRKATSNVSSPSSISSSATSSPKVGSLSSSINKISRVVGRRKVSTQESHDSRLIMLPQIEVKAGDNLRMDLRGHRVRSLTARGLKLSQNLEFVYLRDNLLSSLEGIEILKRVKVLDLSFNDFKGPGFDPLENCKALQQLYLAGNHITSLASLPKLPNLEFLSVAQNRLKSLCMASQPRLQVLAASKNRISTLKGFPHFPILEHLRVEENPILEMSHLEAASVLLVGPTLKKFNDRDLRAEEIELAKQYPAHTALCIRDGWEFCVPELASESTFDFLAERWKNHIPPGYILKEASVDQPFEADACHCHFVFSSDNEPELILKYQWFIGDGIPKGFVAIDDATSEVYWPKHKDIGKFLKVECTPILDGVAYPSIFAASSYVSPGTGCPKVLDLTVHGDVVEGNVIKCQANVAWCGGTPGKGVAGWFRRKWNSSPVVITGAEDEEYKLTIDDIDSSLVLMYTPVTEEGVKGEPQYSKTDFVKAATPSVNSVIILGNPIEGSTIRGVGNYFGGMEGPSKFEWSRQKKETGDILLVYAGTTEYTLTKEDIGWQMIFSYIPMNFEGQEGITVSVATETVRKAPPRVSGLQILGDLREGSKVTITATVTGGTEGSSRVQWFKKVSPLFKGENDLEAVSSSKIAKAFRIPLGVVGYYLIAKFTPMAPDGVSGEPEFVISKNAVENLPPSLNFLSVTGDYCEGEMLTASYGYVGGHEGKSLYSWYLCENETDTGVLIPEASGFLQYRIIKDAIDKFIYFKCTPIREDGIVGDARICLAPERVCSGTPRLLTLKILGEGIEGVTLFADKKYWGGVEGNSVFRWFLSGDNGIADEIEGARDSSYLLSNKDIGFMLCVSCEPVRNDGAHGSTVISHLVGPILPGPPICKSLEFNGSMIQGECLSFSAEYTGGEKGNCTCEWFRIKNNGFREKLSSADYWDLTLLDVGMCIELDYTPFRKDGLKGSPVTICSSVIHPADPKGTELIIPVCYEDQPVVPQKSYYGGHEGDGIYTWYRANKKMEVADMKATYSSEGALVVGNSITYKPTLEDVGAYLVLCWVPTRADGKPGEPVIDISNPVLAALPVVSNVYVKELSSSAYVGEGKYYGGHEGPSIYSWYRETAEGTTSIINGANSTIYEVTDSDYNYQLLFGYKPVRSDSIVGELRLSGPTKTIFPELPQIEMLSFLGKEVEGEILTAMETISNNEVQKNVWNKYIKDVKYQWFCSKVEDTEPVELLPSHCSQTYKFRLEDIGRCLKCECVVTDVFGRSSSIASAVTMPISPGIPKIGKLEIEGRGYHTNLYAVRGIYSGGKEGKSRIQWLRSMVGSPDLISIPGEVDRMYESNVDDVGYRLVAVYTPVREDGVDGQPVSASTETIAIDPDVSKEIKQNIGSGSVKFETLCDKDQSSKKAPGVGNLERRILEVNRKGVKVVKPGSKTSFPSTEIRGTYAPPFHVELYRSDQHRFKIVVDGENEMDLMVQTRHMRDVIVLVIRGFGQKFNSTSLNSLLKIEN